MREVFLQIAGELEEKDLQFREMLAEKTTIDTARETWSVTREVGEFLYHLVLDKQPKHIVEVGMSQGYSTVWLAEAAREYGGKVTTIEIEESKIIAARERFDALGYQDTVTVLEGDARIILEKWTGPIDFLFLDAIKRDYITYLRSIERQLTKNAVVVADDVIEWRRKLDDFFDYIEGNSSYQVSVLELGHGVCLAERT